MTRMSRLRVGANLLAISCLVVGIGVSASASANASAKAGGGKAAKMAGGPRCPKNTVCLYPRANFKGTQRRYHCGDKRPGEYRPTILGQSFPWNSRGGVSSYQNNGVREARLITVGSDSSHPGGTVPLRRNSSSRYLGVDNDLATELHVTC